jgi:voltage-gated sodium channel
VRLVSVLPELRVLIRGMIGALPPLGSMGVLAVLFLYVYGMLGWILFGDELPERWGDIGDAMLFFISFVLLASLLVVNILIAIIINAMEDAREAEQREERARLIAEADDAGAQFDPHIETARRIAALKQAIEDLEAQLGIETGEFQPRSRGPG